MIILANLYNSDTNRYTVQNFSTWDELHRFTFSPKWETLSVYTTGRIPVKGLKHTTLSIKPTADREIIKNWLREFAYTYQESFYNNVVWYGSELCEIESYFERYGKRYGLLKEFKENGII